MIYVNHPKAEPARIESLFKPMTRAEYEAREDRLNPQTIADVAMMHEQYRRDMEMLRANPLTVVNLGYVSGALVPQKLQTRAELQADTERVHRQVMAELEEVVLAQYGMPLPGGSAVESATEGLPPKPYPPGPYPPPAPPPLAAHRMVSVKDDHAVHGPDGLRIFAGRGRKGKWRAEIIAAALDGRWADAQWAKGVIDD